jgi:hypothetical protein
MSIDFIRGFFYGVVFTVVVGFIWDKISNAKRTISDRNKPLDKFSDAQQPSLTPARIVRKSLFAMLSLAIWYILLIAVCIVLIAVALQWEMII